MLVACSSLGAVAWAAPAGLARPPAGHLLVGRAHVPSCQLVAAQAVHLLPAAEQVRAGRYFQAADRWRFVVSRLALRGLLGRCLGCAPSAVQLGAGPTHKPYLLNDPTLHFNLAHTREWVLLALAPAGLGIDVEAVDPHFAYHEVLEVTCGAAEQAALAASSQPRELFYQLWTRKEAFVKATGQGLDHQLPALPVLDGWHRVAGPPEAIWQLCSFVPALGYQAALAYPGLATDWQLAFYDLSADFLQAALAAW